MAEFDASAFPLVVRPAITASPLSGKAVTLATLPQGTVFQVLAAPDADDVAALVETAAATAGLALRAAGPGQWLALSDTPPAAGARLALEAGLAGKAAVVDQSHGRVGIRICGPAAEEVLARGTAVDLDRRAFAIGHSAQTMVGHIIVHLTRGSEDSFDLLVMRSFAESLWEELRTMARQVLPA